MSPEFIEAFRLKAQHISDWIIPAMFFLFALLAMSKRVKLYESFIEGGKEGFSVFLRILPYLVAILAAIGMSRASGMMESLVDFLSPFTTPLGMPPEVLPTALMRPLSGSGSLGLASEVITAAPNSYAADLASTVYGSTDTTFYVIALYFGSVGIKKIRHAVLVGLAADLTGVVAAILICQILFAR